MVTISFLRIFFDWIAFRPRNNKTRENVACIELKDRMFQRVYERSRATTLFIDISDKKRNNFRMTNEAVLEVCRNISISSHY